MDKIKSLINKNPKLFWFFIWIFSFFILRRIHDLASSIVLLAAFSIGLIYSLFTTYNYRKKKLKYVVFRTYNDDYGQFEAFLFSGIALVGLFLSFYADYIDIIWLGWGICVVILLFLNGLFTMPRGSLKIKSNTLRIYGIAEAIEINQINSIDIYNDRLVIKGLNGKTWLASNVSIDKSASDEIIDYLSGSLLGQPITITSQIVENPNQKLVIR